MDAQHMPEADGAIDAELLSGIVDATEKKNSRRGRPKAVPSEYEIITDLQQAFVDADLECPPDFGKNMADGNWHRCLAIGQTGSIRSGNGSYILHWDDAARPTLVCHNFVGGLTTARSYRMHAMKRAEKTAVAAKIKASREALQRQAQIDAAATAEQAKKLWQQLPETGIYGYLATKHLHDAFGLKGNKHSVCIPLYDEQGELRSLQVISPDGTGWKKRFLKNTQLGGLFFEFPDAVDASPIPIVIGEGFATVATIVETTGYHGVAALTCANLDAVVAIFKRRYPRRRIIVCADNDAYWNSDADAPVPHKKGERRPDSANAGVEKARAAALKHGVLLAVCPLLGEGRCMDFNDLYAAMLNDAGEEAAADAVRQAVDAAVAIPGCPTPKGFTLVLENKDGLEPGIYKHGDRDGETDTRLGAPLLVEGHVRALDLQGWGLLVSWRDPDGTAHRTSLSRRDMASKDRTWLSILVDGGYQADSGKAADLLRYLETCDPPRRMLLATKTGWLDDACTCFVLPERIIGTPPDIDASNIIYAGASKAAKFRCSGSLDEWKSSVAALACGNRRLEFAICTAFAGPLLNIIGAENGGVHFVGSSSSGKTTALQTALSVWDAQDAMGSWRATDNAKEGEAYGHNDALLCLDEINQAAPRIVGAVAYMLGNGVGKARSTRSGDLRVPKRFRIVFLSSGEVSLETLLTAHGEAYMAGMDVRILSIKTEKTDITNLHGYDSAHALVTALKTATARFYGSAGTAFVERLLPHLHDSGSDFHKLLSRPALAAMAAALVRSAGYDGSNIDPQILRGAERIALIQLAGVMAKKLDVLPAEFDAMAACQDAFNAWIGGRGGTGAKEDELIIAATKSFILRYKDDRFSFTSEKGEYFPARNAAGFKQHRDGKTFYYTYPSIIEKDAWANFPINTVLATLKKDGFLIASEGQQGRRHYKQLKTIPGDNSRQWLYCLVLPDEK